MLKTHEINIPAGNSIDLKGSLTIPSGARAFVVFSHGSGSSRFSSRNRHVADVLNKNNIVTLLTDLLTEQEDHNYEMRFDIGLITARLISVINHCVQLPELKNMPVGCFGTSTGAASALRAAARLKDIVSAVVSRGGRPDLAGGFLPGVKAPTLLIVGSLDTAVIDLNKAAYSELQCEKELKIVQGAAHLFEEPGKLDEVARLAAGWFNKHLILYPKLTRVQ